MARISLNIILNTNDNKTTINTTGVVENNNIKYIDNDIIVVINIKDNIITMNRDSSEYHINLIFDNNKDTVGSYLLKKNNAKFDLDIHTTLINITDNYIEVEYILNDEKIYFKVEIGEVI